MRVFCLFLSFLTFCVVKIRLFAISAPDFASCLIHVNVSRETFHNTEVVGNLRTFLRTTALKTEKTACFCVKQRNVSRETFSFLVVLSRTRINLYIMRLLLSACSLLRTIFSVL